jgi:hypothetical protein
MDFKQWLQNIKSLRNALETGIPDALLATATDTTSQIRNRSQDGIFVNAEQGATVDYSQNEVRTYYWYNQALNQRGRDYIKKNKKGTWGKFREAQGLSSDNVNLSYSGRFWASLVPGRVQRVANTFLVDVAVNDSEVQQYAGQLVDRYGNFYEPTQQEAAQASVVLVDQLERFLKQYL